jgi:hypothetical protein
MQVLGLLPNLPGDAEYETHGGGNREGEEGVPACYPLHLRERCIEIRDVLYDLVGHDEIEFAVLERRILDVAEHETDAGGQLQTVILVDV